MNPKSGLWSFATALLFACSPPVSSTDAGTVIVPEPDSGAAEEQIVELMLSPEDLQLAPGDAASLSVTARDLSGAMIDFTGRVNWTVDLTDVAQVQSDTAQGTAQVVAVSRGVANVVATFQGLRSNPSRVQVEVQQTADAGVDAGATDPDGGVEPANREVRALWVTRFGYSDEAGVRAVIRQAASSGFNVVFFQIRGNGDAYYKSSLVPWAKRLSGVLGRDPGWDPLEVAITEAHSLGIELHAYFNAFTAWPTPSGCSGTGTCGCSLDPDAGVPCALPEASEGSAPTHYLRAHPSSLAVDSQGFARDTEYYWFSPADPNYRAHLLATVEELLQRYDVDGLHLDRIRYPGPWSSYDPASEAAWAALPAPKPVRADWQRAQVSDAVNAIFEVVQRVKPDAVLSAAVWGIYTPLWGCNTSQGYSNYFQDSIGWVRDDRIDWIVPMIYWDLNTGCTAFDQHLNAFVKDGRGPRVVAGMQGKDGASVAPSKVTGRIEYARNAGAAGVSIYSSASFGAGDWSFFRSDGGVFSADAGVPPPAWR